jgi:cytochrome c peroxidase
MSPRAGRLLLAMAVAVALTSLAPALPGTPLLARARAGTEPPGLPLSPAERAQVLSHGPWPGATPGDPGNRFSGLAPAQALGRLLFDEPALSGDGRLACRSCHDPARGFTDGLPTAQGRAPLARNTQGLNDLALQRWFGWDGGSDSLWAASLRPLLDPREMGATAAGVARAIRERPALAELLARARAAAGPGAFPPGTPPDEADLVDAAKAIGAWLASLRSPRTAFDDFRDALARDDHAATARYPAAALRGLRLFIGEGRCHLCHVGPAFSNGEFHDIGMPFMTGPGQVDPGRHAGLRRLLADRHNLGGGFADPPPPGTPPERDPALKTRTVNPQHRNFGEWRTPSLRGLSASAPYMHDGRLPSLAAVIDHYDRIDTERLHADGESLLRPLRLSPAQRADLLAFLLSLDPQPSPNAPRLR